MRVLVSVPTSRNLPRVFQSIHNIEYDGEIRFAFERGGDNPVGIAITSPGRRENCLRKALIDRDALLCSSFDAMLHIDDDTIVPPDVLTKLLALDSPVAYGLYCWRNAPHWWNILHTIDEHRPDIYGMHSGDMQRAWGKSFEVAGVGTGCVLIRRAVLAHIPFRLLERYGYDYAFAMDCVSNGIRQMVDTSVICGHVDPEHNRIYWPTPDGYTSEPYFR